MTQNRPQRHETSRVGAPKDQPADDPWAQNATAGTNYGEAPF